MMPQLKKVLIQLHKEKCNLPRCYILREAGVPISSKDLLEAATVQNKNRIMENAMAQEQQAIEIQQQRAQLEMAQIQSQIKLSEARAQADQGLGLERVSRVQENQALAIERRAEAQKDRELGILHLAKAIKELEDIDLSQLQKIIELSRMVKRRGTTS